MKQNPLNQVLKGLYDQSVIHTTLLGKIADSLIALGQKSFGGAGNGGDSLVKLLIAAYAHSRFTGGSKAGIGVPTPVSNPNSANAKVQQAMSNVAKAYNQQAKTLTNVMQGQGFQYAISAKDNLNEGNIKKNYNRNDLKQPNTPYSQIERVATQKELMEDVRRNREQGSRKQQLTDYLKGGEKSGGFKKELGLMGKDFKNELKFYGKKIYQGIGSIGLVGGLLAGAALGYKLAEKAWEFMTPGEGFIGSNVQAYNKIQTDTGNQQKDFGSMLFWTSPAGSLVGGIIKGVF